MEINKYISELLYRYDCVIIPGFGGFIANEVSAKNISSHHKFIPPTKNIAFNKNLDSNDGLLANYISKAKNISYNNSLELINKSVENWNKQLAEHNTFEIKRLGYFKISEEGVLEFNDEGSTNYLIKSYGLSNFTSIAIERENKIKSITSKIDNNSSSGFRKVLRYAAIIVPLITIGSLSYFQSNTITSDSARIEILPDSKPTVVKVEKHENTIVITPKGVAKEVVAVKEEIIVKQDFKKYHVIAGAFSSEKNAIKSINALQVKGYNAKLIGVNKKGLFMVAYDSFTTFNKAKPTLFKIKNQENKQVWIWKHKIDLNNIK